MRQKSSKKFLIISAALHLSLLLAIVLTVEFTSPLVVVENTNQHDVISAVVLGDTLKSKILPQKVIPPKPVEIEKKPEKEPIKEVIKEPVKPKVEEKKPIEKVVPLKVVEKKKPTDIFGKDLLADIEKVKKKVAKQKKEKQKKLDAQFQKTLREQAEKTMRSHLLDEALQLRSSEMHASQGVINKYQALIQQALREHWIVPPQTNKKLLTVLTIRLAPGGAVLDVQITKSSGDRALDNSARAAVLKASPLPVPTNAADFETFRHFTLNARPLDIQDAGLAG